MSAPTVSVRGSVLRNTAWNTLSVVASPVLAFLFGGLTLRYLGLEQAGYALTVGAVFSIVSRFSTLGLGSAALPSLAAAISANDILRIRRLFGMLLIVFGLSATATALFLVGVAPWFNRWAQCPLPPRGALMYLMVGGLTHVLGQIGLVLTVVLRAANRYDLVTLATTPLAFATGLAACILLPLFPTLLTMAAVSAVATIIGTSLTAWIVMRAVPSVGRPQPGFAEFPGLARYGSWLTLSNAFAVLTTGVDELVVVGLCGPATLPPWAIGKRLWTTIHTFLAQHVEHLVPLLSSLRSADDRRVDRIAASMHWYVMLLASAVYSLMAWSGEAVVGLVAGEEVAPACRPAVLAFSLFGLGFAVMIVPVTLSLAKGVSRPSFEVSVILQVALFVPLCILAWGLGVPWLYYAPVIGVPLLPLASMAMAVRAGESHVFRRWFQPALIPVALGALVIGAAQLPSSLSDGRMIIVGGFLAVVVLAATISLESWLNINHLCHEQLREILSQGISRGMRVPSQVIGACQRLRS